MATLMNAKADEIKLEETATAIFAGGCFWCMESVFDYEDGVIKTTSGYTGGKTENPTYEQVSAGNTGHYEALEVIFDPKKTNYSKLLDVFWRNIDPTDGDGQFADRGSHYQTAVFYFDDKQKEAAELSKIEVAKTLESEVKTKILPAKKFYPAEDYHQNYHEENALRYQIYYSGSGRKNKLDDLWGGK